MRTLLVWLVVATDGKPAHQEREALPDGRYVSAHLSESEAERAAAGMRGQARYAGSPLVVEVVQVEAEVSA